MEDAKKVEKLAQIYRSLRGRAGCCELQDLMESVLETVDSALAQKVWDKDTEISWSEYEGPQGYC